jgi:hypothetical protein
MNIPEPTSVLPFFHAMREAYLLALRRAVVLKRQFAFVIAPSVAMFIFAAVSGNFFVNLLFCFVGPYVMMQFSALVAQEQDLVGTVRITPMRGECALIVVRTATSLACFIALIFALSFILPETTTAGTVRLDETKVVERNSPTEPAYGIFTIGAVLAPFLIYLEFPTGFLHRLTGALTLFGRLDQRQFVLSPAQAMRRFWRFVDLNLAFLFSVFLFNFMLNIASAVLLVFLEQWIESVSVRLIFVCVLASINAITGFAFYELWRMGVGLPPGSFQRPQIMTSAVTSDTASERSA